MIKTEKDVENAAEIFAKPAAGAIIENVNEGVNYILVQERCKAGDTEENGLIKR